MKWKGCYIAYIWRGIGRGGVYEQEHNHDGLDGVSCAMSLLPEIL